MKNAIILPLMFCLAVGAQAQVKKHIKRGRRYKSESQFALKKHDFQVEWEVGRENVDSQLTTVVYPNLELHYALSDRLEINAETSLITTKVSSTLLEKNTSGIEPVLIGANYQVLRDSYNSPSIIISTQLAIPFLATKEFTANHLAPIVLVDVQEAVRKKWLFGLSSGLIWDGFSTSPSFIYNASTSYSFAKKWMLTTECFGFINDDLPQNNLDASLAYVINDLIQFAFTAGTGISSAASKNYFSVNGTWGFNTSKKRQVH